MSIILHHLKSEYKLNAKVMWFTMLVLLIMCYGLSIDSTGVDSVQIIWYSLVAGMVTSSAYKKDFSLKYFAALPIPRDQLILMIILGRVIYFIPGALTLSVYYSSLPRDPLLNHSWPLLMLTYFIFVSVFNAMQVLGDIENPRLESVPGRFESFLMFFKKIAINYVLGGTLLIGGFLFVRAIIVGLGMEFLNNQFLLVIYGGALLTFLMYRCHQVFLNEHLSYWSWKRDGVLATLFIVAAIVPAITYKKKLANLVYHNGDSPYFIAVSEGDIEAIKKLKESGSDINVKNELGYTPILSAIRKGKLDVVKALESIGAQINQADLVSPSALAYPPLPGKLTPIHLAVLSNEPEMFSYLVNKPNVLESLNSREVKVSPLHLAAGRCYPAMIPELIGAGADINARLKDYTTPLISAVKADCYAAVIELSMAGANSALKDESGKTVFDYAKGRQMKHLLARFNPEKSTQNRLPASTNLANPHMKR